MTRSDLIKETLRADISLEAKAVRLDLLLPGCAERQRERFENHRTEIAAWLRTIPGLDVSP